MPIALPIAAHHPADASAIDISSTVRIVVIRSAPRPPYSTGRAIPKMPCCLKARVSPSGSRRNCCPSSLCDSISARSPFAVSIMSGAWAVVVMMPPGERGGADARSC
jgi:hypothetical protein